MIKKKKFAFFFFILFTLLQLYFLCAYLFILSSKLIYLLILGYFMLKVFKKLLKPNSPPSWVSNLGLTLCLWKWPSTVIWTMWKRCSFTRRATSPQRQCFGRWEARPHRFEPFWACLAGAYPLSVAGGHHFADVQARQRKSERKKLGEEEERKR